MDIATLPKTATIQPSSNRLCLRMPHPSLERVLQELNVTPVSLDDLVHHRKTMIEANPANWLYRHMDAILGTGTLIGGACLFAALLTPYYWLMGGMLVPMLMMIALLSSIRVRGPATWVVQPVTLAQISAVAPAEIAALVRQLKAEMPTVTFRLGKLIQNKVVLDPYIIATDGKTQACLGIWLDEKIVAMAIQGAK